MSDKDGGPAFPMPGQYRKAGDVEITDETLPGMSLRDYFAGQALVGIALLIGSEDVHRVAENSYGLADAMLAERAKVKP